MNTNMFDDLMKTIDEDIKNDTNLLEKQINEYLQETIKLIKENKQLKEENQRLRTMIHIYNTTYGLQRNKPEFVDTRFMQRGERYGQCVTLERCYKCPKCNSHLFLKVHEHKYCPECGLKFDRSDIDKEE